MTDFRYPAVERQIVEALPEIRPAAAFYWNTEGAPGKDCGPYIFFEDLFARYVEILLWLPPTSRRDELLRRAFEVVEGMLGSADLDVQTLATVGLFEGRDAAWLARARSFVGSRSRAYLTAHEPQWHAYEATDDQRRPELLDGYHVRAIISRELGLPLNDVPGKTYAGELPPDSDYDPGPFPIPKR